MFLSQLRSHHGTSIFAPFGGFLGIWLVSLVIIAAACGGCGGKKNTDIEIPDSGLTDGSVTGDGGTGTDVNAKDSWGAGDPTLCSGPNAPKTCASDSDCFDKPQLCIKGGCNGKKYCEYRGTKCTSQCPGCPSADPIQCPPGLACGAPIGGDSVCTYTNPNSSSEDQCQTKRSCVVGDACEGSPKKCVDRRLPCDTAYTTTGDGNCPAGYICSLQSAANPYCVQAMLPCNPAENGANLSNAACTYGNFKRCINVFDITPGQGTGRCYPPPSSSNACTKHSDCSGGKKCGLVLESGNWRTACTAEGRGACRVDQVDADCPSGYSCFDLDGSKFPACSPKSGTCNADKDCQVNARCMALPTNPSKKVCACFDPGTKTLRDCNATS